MDVGAGGWDRSSGRARSGSTGCSCWRRTPIRREGAALAQAIFDRVVAAAREYHTFT